MPFLLSAVFALLGTVFLGVLILGIIGFVLIAVLLIHSSYLRFIFLRHPAGLACPDF